MTPLSQAERQRLLRHSGSTGRVSSLSARDELLPHGSCLGQSPAGALAVGRSTGKSEPKKNMSNKTGRARKSSSLDESDVRLLDNNAPMANQTDGSRPRFKFMPWSQDKPPPPTNDQASVKPLLGSTTIAALEEGVRYHVARMKTKVNLRWPMREENEEDREFKDACASDLNKRTRDVNFGIHATSPSKRPVNKHKGNTDPSEHGGDLSKSSSKQNITSANQSKYVSPLLASSPLTSKPFSPICISATTNQQALPSTFPQTGISQCERPKQTCDTKEVNGTTNVSKNKAMLNTPFRNPLLKSDSADHDRSYRSVNARPPLARAASASAASTELARQTAAGNGQYPSGSKFDPEQRPAASKTFFSIEYLKANLKLDLKLPDLPLPKSLIDNRNADLKRDPKSPKSNGSPELDEDDYSHDTKLDRSRTTSSRHTMTDDSTNNSKAQTSRYLRLSAFVQEPGRGRSRPTNSQTKSAKITQRKPKHPPQNIRRAPAMQPEAECISSSTQTSPVTVQMIDLGELHSPPGHPDFDPYHRPWHSSCTHSGLYSPRGNGSVETLTSDDYDDGSDSSLSSPSSPKDWQCYRQLSPITEADYSYESEDDGWHCGDAIDTTFQGDQRNRYAEEMMKHKSFQNVQDEDSPSSQSTVKDVNQASPYRSPSYTGNNLLTIPGTFNDTALQEKQHTPSLKTCSRGFRSAGSFSALDTPKHSGHHASMSRSFDAGLTAKNNSRYMKEENRKKSNSESSPVIPRRSLNLTVDYNGIHRSYTDSRLSDREDGDNQHQPLIRQRSDSAALERPSKRSPEPRRQSDFRRSSGSPSIDDVNGRRRRTSPNIERQRSDSMIYDSSSKRSPDARHHTDLRQSSRSPVGDDGSGRRHRNSPKLDDPKKTRAHLFRHIPDLNNDPWTDDVSLCGAGMKWFDVDDDFNSMSACTLNDNGMVVSTKRARSFDTSYQCSTRTPEMKKRNSLSPRDDRKDRGNGHDQEKRRARSFDCSAQSRKNSQDIPKRNSLSPRDDPHDSINRYNDPDRGYDHDRRRARSFDCSTQNEKRNSLSLRDECKDDRRRARSFDCSPHSGNRTPESKKRNSLSPRVDYHDFLHSAANVTTPINKPERKSPVIKRNRRVEALSPLITISHSFDDPTSGSETPGEETPRRRRTTGSLSLLTEHIPLPDSPTGYQNQEDEPHTPKSREIERCKGRVITRVYSDETNRRFVPLERQVRPRRVCSEPSASSPPPSPLYPTVHIVPPPNPLPGIENKHSAYCEERGIGEGRSDDFEISERKQLDRETTNNFPSMPVINIDTSFECQGYANESEREQRHQCRHSQSSACKSGHRAPAAAKHAMMAGNRSFDMPSSNRVASECACQEHCSNRRAASFSSFAPSRETHDIWRDSGGSDDDDDDSKEDRHDLNNTSAAGNNSVAKKRDGKTLFQKNNCDSDSWYANEKESSLQYQFFHRSHSSSNRAESFSDRFPLEDHGAPISKQRSHAPVTRSLTDSDVIVDSDRKRRSCDRNRRVTSLDSNPLLHSTHAPRSSASSHRSNGPLLRHMPEKSRHVITAPDPSSSPRTCALHRRCINETPPLNSKTRSRSCDVACDGQTHRDSLTDACANFRKAVRNRKISSPASCSSNSNSNSNSNGNHSSNNNLLNIPHWNSALGKFSSSDSRLTVPGQELNAPLKKTSSVPPSFPDSGTFISKSNRSASLQSSHSFQQQQQQQYQCSARAIRHHSTDESVLGRNFNLSHSHLFNNACHSSPHIPAITPSSSPGERRFTRQAIPPRCYNPRDNDFYQALASSNSQRSLSDRGSPNSSHLASKRIPSHGSFQDRLSSRSSLNEPQPSTSAGLGQDTPPQNNAETAPEEVETTPLLSTPAPMAGAGAAVDGRGIEIIVSDENDARVSTVQTGKRAVLRRIWMVLLDNRMAGRPDCERALRPHPEEYRVLKRILNIVFITVGVALLISVFVVIIYTYVGEY